MINLLSRVQSRYRQLVQRDTKAISHHPELRHRVHILQQYDSAVSTEIDAFADYASVYKSYVWVRKAVGKITDSIAYLPVAVVDKNGEAIPSHPVSELLRTANDTLSPHDLWQRWAVHHMLGGESFFELVLDGRGRPAEFWPRVPDQVAVLPDVSSERALFPRVAGYTFGDDDHLVPPELMWHSKFYNPTNPWRGLAPIAAVRQGIVIDLFAQAWSKAFLKRGARPDYAVIAPQGLTRTEKDDLESQLMEKFSGQDNWHRPIVLEEGITKIETFSFAPKDIEWLEQRKLARDEIGGIFGVPDEVMGYGRDTYENMDAAHRWFWRLTLLPLVTHRDVSLTHFFTKVNPQLRPGERVSTDLSGVGALSEDIAPKLEQAKSLWGMGVPLDVIDERLSLGLGPVPGGNVGYLPVNLLPVGSDTLPAQQLSVRNRRAVVKRTAVPAYGSPAHKALWNSHLARITPHERAMQRQLKRTFQRQQNEVLRILRNRTAGKTVSDIPSVDELFNVAVEDGVVADEVQTFLVAAFSEFATEQLNDLASGVAFDQNQAVTDYIKHHAAELAQNIDETTMDRLRGILVEGQNEGLSMAEIQDKINEMFNGRKSTAETERIARTEMNRASNQGIIEGMRQSGVVQRKAWLAALDIRTRDTHVAAHLQYQESPIPLEAMFEVGGGSGPAPGQIGIAAEDINCRCVAMAVVD